jgi:hypothetical protein
MEHSRMTDRPNALLPCARPQEGLALDQLPPALIDKALAADRDARRRLHAVMMRKMCRWNSNILALWGLCPRAACRRARQCRGNAVDCFRRYGPLVPQHVRDAAELLYLGILEGLTFEQAWENPEQDAEALNEWLVTVERANDPRPIARVPPQS